MSKKITGTAAVALLSLGLSLAVAPPALANAPHALPPASSAASHQTSFSDEDVVAFLAGGQGRIAAAHPELASRLTMGTEARPLDPQQTSALTKELVSIEPAFTEKITQPLQSGDPYEVLSGLEAYADTMQQLIDLRGVGDTGGVSGQCLVVLAAGVLLWVAVSTQVYFYGANSAVTEQTTDLAADIARSL